MYVPKAFRLDDRAAIEEIVAACDFGLLVTAVEGRLQATHLPLLLERGEDGSDRLLGHVARANPQWRDLAALSASGGEALAVFQGPHAYVSPTWYGPAAEGRSVPTWNYLAVHAYGRPRLIESPEAVRALLARLSAHHEGSGSGAWSLARLEETRLEGLMRGIVAFELPVARLEGKAKLSQDKAADWRAGVIEALDTADGGLARGTAAWMRRLA